VRLGHVTDWIHVTHYPTFNLADSCITVGMLTLAVYLLFLDRSPRRDG
jgi:lipoprotein signal peptidase